MEASHEYIGKWVEVVADGRRVWGTIYNVYKNGKFQIRPEYTRHYDKVTLIPGKAPMVNVKAKWCEQIPHPIFGTF
jgi:hypothetical protein